MDTPGIPHAHAQAREDGVGEFMPAERAKPKRRKHLPDEKSRELVEKLSGIGVPERDIAKILTVRVETFRQLYRDELESGRAKAVAEIAKVAFQEAKQGGNAMMFWLRCRAGWSETQHVELTGKDGAPLQPAAGVLLVPMPLSEEDWEKQVTARQAKLLKG